jgi:hypothetical protein
MYNTAGTYTITKIAVVDVSFNQPSFIIEHITNKTVIVQTDTNKIGIATSLKNIRIEY